MFSVFDEVTRDFEKEQKDRSLHTANSMLQSSLMPFVASAKNAEQYTQYKAMVADSLRTIASQCEVTFEEISEMMDKKMSYILEAQQVEAGAMEKTAEGERFYIIDGRGKRVGGSYSSRETAQTAIRRGEVKSSTGLRVIPAATYRAATGTTAFASEKSSESHVDPFKALASLRQALREGVNPLEWVNDSGGVKVKDGTPSEHNSTPAPESGNHKEAQGPNVNSPSDPNSAGAERSMGPGPTEHVNVPTPEVQVSGGSPTSSPMEQPRHMPNNPLGPSLSKIKDEIARYNPSLSEEKIESIAVKVASTYFAREEER